MSTCYAIKLVARHSFKSKLYTMSRKKNSKVNKRNPENVEFHLTMTDLRSKEMKMDHNLNFVAAADYKF